MLFYTGKSPTFIFINIKSNYSCETFIVYNVPNLPIGLVNRL